jgi:hypothetical protein
MYSIEIPHIEHVDFLHFISKHTELIDIKNYLIHIDDTTEKRVHYYLDMENIKLNIMKIYLK